MARLKGGFTFLLFLLVFERCVNHDLVKHVDCNQTDLVLAVDSVSRATSCGVNDGTIYISAAGGLGAYKFSLNDEAYQSSTIFSELASGIYTINVVDENGCKVSVGNVVLSAKDFQVSANVVNDTDCLNHNGAITVTVDASNPPFTYKLNDGNFSTTNSFSGLKAGQYHITVRDNIDCNVQLSITVPHGSTVTSWANDILPIMKTSCALSGCHDGKTRFDYKDYQTAKRDASMIKSMTQNRSMPFDGTPLTQNQIDLIACWVDDGAPDN